MENTASRRDVLALTLGLGGAGALGCAAPKVESIERASEDAFPELEDQRPRLGPIDAGERRERRARLGAILARAGLDAYFCEGGPTMTYLAGIGWGKSERTFGLVVLADGSHFWLCPAFEAEKARLSIERDGGPGGEIVPWDEHEYAWKPLGAALDARRAARIAMDPGTRCFVPELLREQIGADRVRLGRSVLVELRGTKSEHELELLRVASENTQRAILAVSKRVHAGMSGNEVAALMSRAHQKLGMTQPWCLALTGPAAAYPHGDHDGVVVKPGDFLLVDTGASFHGYQSDTTRTWCVEGRPSEKQQRVWSAVRDAQRRAFDAIRPGVRCGDVDRAARASLDESGFGGSYRTFTHRLGHGIGLEGHEDPYFDGGSEVALAPGMTLSNEPGLYFYGEFGVRLEDIVLCTASGAEHFGKWQTDWTSPG
jgi:Xaa-Pro dipeptidase